MLDLIWMAGDIWRELFWIRWMSYVVFGIILFLSAVYAWVSYREHHRLKQYFQKNLLNITDHQKITTPGLEKKLPESSIIKRLKQAHRLSQIQTPWSQIWRNASFISFILVALVFLQTKSWLFALSIPFFVFGFASLMLVLKSLDQRKKLVEQVPLFLQALSNSLEAGYTLPMALDCIAEEMDAPIKAEVKMINQKLSLQIPLSEALQDFSDKVQNPEVDFFVESTLIQIKTGGNLISLFNKTSYLIEEKLKLRRDIRSFTSQGKMSGILIAALWPISVLAFSWISPTHTEALFNTPAGKLMLFTSLTLELAGFFFIWKIISVRL